ATHRRSPSMTRGATERPWTGRPRARPRATTPPRCRGSARSVLPSTSTTPSCSSTQATALLQNSCLEDPPSEVFDYRLPGQFRVLLRRGIRLRHLHRVVRDGRVPGVAADRRYVGNDRRLPVADRPPCRPPAPGQ